MSLYQLKAFQHFKKYITTNVQTQVYITIQSNKEMYLRNYTEVLNV